MAAFALLVGGIALVPLGAVPVEFFPNIDQGTIAINTRVAPGTSLTAHDAIMRQIESQLAAIPEIQTYSASIGASQTFGIGAASVTQGTVAIDIGSRQDRGQLACLPWPTIYARASHPDSQCDDPGAGERRQWRGSGRAVRIQGPDVNVLTSLAISSRRR